MRRSALVTCLLLLGMLVSRASRAGDARTSAAIWQSLNGEADLVALSRAMLSGRNTSRSGWYRRFRMVAMRRAGTSRVWTV